jgi:tetratricopeptide (TPR) repeat protein
LRSLGYIGAGGEYVLDREGIDPKAFAPLYRKLSAVHELSATRRWNEAVPVYRELLAAFPRSSVLACELGLAEMALGHAAEAEADLRRALDRDAGNAHALLGMANLAIARKDFGVAESHLREVLRLDPDDVEGNFDLGALYLQSLNQPVKAAPYLRRFVELQPNDAETPRIREILARIEKTS